MDSSNHSSICFLCSFIHDNWGCPYQNFENHPTNSPWEEIEDGNFITFPEVELNNLFNKVTYPVQEAQTDNILISNEFTNNGFFKHQINKHWEELQEWQVTTTALKWTRDDIIINKMVPILLNIIHADFKRPKTARQFGAYYRHRGKTLKETLRFTKNAKFVEAMFVDVKKLDDYTNTSDNQDEGSSFSWLKDVITAIKKGLF
ncbi:unnamed protein product [Cunninghamella blakesleeana]